VMMVPAGGEKQGPGIVPHDRVEPQGLVVEGRRPVERAHAKAASPGRYAPREGYSTNRTMSARTDTVG
jgi:hypothetical protein